MMRNLVLIVAIKPEGSRAKRFVDTSDMDSHVTFPEPEVSR